MRKKLAMKATSQKKQIIEQEIKEKEKRLREGDDHDTEAERLAAIKKVEEEQRKAAEEI